MRGARQKFTNMAYCSLVKYLSHGDTTLKRSSLSIPHNLEDKFLMKPIMLSYSSCRTMSQGNTSTWGSFLLWGWGLQPIRQLLHNGMRYLILISWHSSACVALTSQSTSIMSWEHSLMLLRRAKQASSLLLSRPYSRISLRYLLIFSLSCWDRLISSSELCWGWFLVLKIPCILTQKALSWLYIFMFYFSLAKYSALSVSLTRLISSPSGTLIPASSTACSLSMASFTISRSALQAMPRCGYFWILSELL